MNQTACNNVTTATLSTGRMRLKRQVITMIICMRRVDDRKRSRADYFETAAK